MTTASDRWIRERSQGAVGYKLYYGNEFKGEMTLDSFRSDRAHFADIAALQPGQSFDYTIFAPGHGHEGVDLSSAHRVECFQKEIERPLISPFFDRSMKTLDIIVDGETRTVKCPSYGLSSYGYDIRVDRRFKVFHANVRRGIPFDKLPVTEQLVIADVNRIQQIQLRPDLQSPCVVQTVDVPGLVLEDYTTDLEADYIDLPPGGFVLGVSMERVCMPKDVTAVCMQKSTIARMGLVAYVTPLEAGWEGFVTLEISNHSPNTIRLWAGIGIMQLLFHVGSEDCMVSYADRAGKYQNQPDAPVPGTF